ncbi:hypothetical protein BGX34_005154 [Mortierella sp. NVP85]|nr:hypothetical protein BGX34_005154 [Mortierella sp. NVP85]
MSHSGKFINPDEVVRHKDGRVDLFNTILARKDPSAQIPVLKDTSSSLHGTSSTSLPLPDTTEASFPHRQYSASAPHASDMASSTTQRKRRASKSPSPVDDDDNTGQGHAVKAVKKDGDISGTPARTSSPRPVVAAGVAALGAARGGGRAFERVFIGYCSRPSTVPAEIAYWYDDQHLIIKDMYPKAKVHMLVIPRQRIDKVTDLKGPAGIKTVEQVVERANILLEELKKESPLLEFKMGFHIIPSILQLHLHVISQDFCSTALKTKQHWNSFTTPYFVTPEKVISTIQEKGSFAMSPKDLSVYEAMLKRDLQCNQCKDKLNNMPTLKRHLEGHFALKEKASAKTKK